jgi:hypothetical protein
VPSSHTAQLGTFLDAYDAGRRPPGSGREARGTLEFAAALYKAAFTGRPVRAGEIAPGDPFHEAMHGGRTDWTPREHA